MENDVHPLRRRHEGDGASMLRQALRELEEARAHVLLARWGAGRESSSDEAGAKKHGVRVEHVRHLQGSAFALLGFLWLTSTPPTSMWRPGGSDASGDLGEAA